MGRPIGSRRWWSARGLAAGGLAIAAIAAPALAAGPRAESIRDDRDADGSVYSSEGYAMCDILKVTAQRKTRFLFVKVTVRGEQSEGAMRLHLRTTGGRRSDPDYFADFTNELIETGGVAGNTPINPESKGPLDVKYKNGGSEVVYEIPLRKIGKPEKTGVQARTCGEGLVDLAPGGNYFDSSVPGAPWQYINVETG